MNRTSYKHLRNGLGMSQMELARRLGVSQTTVSRWETGLTTPDADVRKRLIGMAVYNHADWDIHIAQVIHPSPLLAVACDLGLIVVAVSQGTIRRTGMPPTRLIGMDIRRLMAGDFLNVWQRGPQKALLSGKAIAVEIDVPALDMARRPIRFRGRVSLLFNRHDEPRFIVQGEQVALIEPTETGNTPRMRLVGPNQWLGSLLESDSPRESGRARAAVPGAG